MTTKKTLSKAPSKPTQITVDRIVKSELVATPRNVNIVSTDDYLKYAFSSNTIGNGLIDTLLLGSPLPFESAKQYTQLVNSSRDKTIYPEPILRESISSACQLIDLAVKIRKTTNEPLLAKWNADIEAKVKANEVNAKKNIILKKNGATELPMLRNVKVSLAGLKKLVIKPQTSSKEELLKNYLSNAYTILFDKKDNANIDKITALMTGLKIDIPKKE